MTSSQLSETDIANFALDLLTEAPMGSIEDPQGAIERLVARLYPSARDAALKKHWWKHARMTASLPSIAETDQEFANVYQLPSDCLIVWTFNGREDGFERRAGQGSGKIASHDAPPGNLVYGRRLPAGETPPEIALFIAAEIAHLAATAPGIDAKESRLTRIAETRDEREETALLICGAEGGVEQQFRSRYLDAAHGYNVYRPAWDR